MKFEPRAKCVSRVYPKRNMRETYAVTFTHTPHCLREKNGQIFRPIFRQIVRIFPVKAILSVVVAVDTRTQFRKNGRK